MDSFGAFLDTQLLRVERLMRKETRSEQINRELYREAACGVEVVETKHTVPFEGMAQIGIYGQGGRQR